MQSDAIDRTNYENAGRPLVGMPKDYPDGHAVGWHSHRRAQLVYAISGVMEVRTVDGLWLVPPQRALWIPAGVEHDMQGRGPVSLRTLYIHPDTCPVDVPPGPRALEVSVLLRELILRAVAMPLDHVLTMHDEHILALLMDEIACAPDRALHLPAARDRRLARVCRAMLDDPGDDRSLDAWATSVGASTRTLARLFQFEFGCSFLMWRQQVRVLAALPRLAAGEPVTAIALDLGYETPSAFTAMFKRLMGETPGRYFR